MGADQNIDWRMAAASALEWWRDAGIDALVDEQPRDWTAVPTAPVVAQAQVQARIAVAAPVVLPLPRTLDDFLAWRAGPDAPEAGWPGNPIAASGDPSAAIMILTDLPDRDDSDSGSLFSGAVGRLFDRMLAAIGQSRDSVYLVPMCSLRPMAGRIAPEIEARLVEVARHHVGLVAPKRLLVLGNAPSRALTGMDVAHARGSLHSINLEEGMPVSVVDVVASFHPRLLLERPAEKARAWKDLQMLIAGLGA
ncbi:uracil-DNA glycosylase [Sphingomonas sp. RB3P16]|uniref:uracil-DNA glycosylase n=1 Tax=Parasphingomonas frigoris TaxID=3096163 RepID=UPI002FCC90E5